jgi:hypothetical protein
MKVTEIVNSEAMSNAQILIVIYTTVVSKHTTDFGNIKYYYCV